MFIRKLFIIISAGFFIYFLLLQLYFGLYIKRKKGHNLNWTTLKISSIYVRILSMLNDEALLDSSKMYKIINIKQERKLSSFDVTYVSQCSWNKLHLVKSILETWQGPVSIAVFSEVEYIEEALWSVSIAVHCHQVKLLDLHLVVPAEDAYTLNDEHLTTTRRRLDGPELCDSSFALEEKAAKNYNWTKAYPINLLRNIAKNSSSTRYVFVTDIDMLPNQDLRRNFLRYVWFKKLNSKKLAYVVPAFEMVAGGKLPQNKAEVLLEIQKRNIRPFYFVPCHGCHAFTNYSKWFSFKNLPGMRAIYKVDWKYPWEPFYISSRDVPDYDERFKQYGFNRISQICQLYIEGYDFLILDNAFLIHSGFKSVADFHSTKNLEMDSNRKLYEKFKEKMKIKYQHVSRRC